MQKPATSFEFLSLYINALAYGNDFFPENNMGTIFSSLSLESFHACGAMRIWDMFRIMKLFIDRFYYLLMEKESIEGCKLYVSSDSLLHPWTRLQYAGTIYVVNCLTSSATSWAFNSLMQRRGNFYLTLRWFVQWAYFGFLEILNKFRLDIVLLAWLVWTVNCYLQWSQI